MTSDESSSKLFNFDKPPILMVGSGISKRYLSNFKTWDELLQSIANRMGIDKRTYIAHKHIADNNQGDYGTLPELANDLRKLLFDQLITKKINAEDLFTSTEELKMYDEGTDPFKILVSSEVSNYSVRTDEITDKELKSFRNLINVIPAVITTNYDCFLENEIFKEFAVYSSVSDHYFFNSDGIGEIYKLHGSAEYPESLVITSKDYREYSGRSKIVSAKVLSMMCDYPLLIIGYSLSDDDVSQLIYDLISSLNEESLQTLKKNIIYIVYDNDTITPIRGTKTFRNDNGEFTLNTIHISDFSEIYDELGTYSPSVSPNEVRRIRQLVKNIVLTAQPTEEQYVKLGIDSLDSKSGEKITLIVSEKELSKALKEYVPITPESLMDDYLSDEITLEPDLVLRYFSVYSNFKTTMFIPLYPYIRLSKISPDNYSNKLREFIEMKEGQLTSKIANSKKIFEGFEIDDKDIFKNVMDYNKPVLILYLLDSKIISASEAKELLIKLRNYYGKGNKNFDSNFRCATTFLSKIEK